MGSNEKFCLRWNDFETNISVAFRELREDKDFFDVTLACDDSQVQAHKVILSACSPFFRQILRRNPHQHPLLYLKGVKYKELLSVLNFMYQGEVNVAQEELNSFLAVAEDLRVKGLTQNNAESSDKPVKSESSKASVGGGTSSAGNSRIREPPDRSGDTGPPPKRSRPIVPTAPPPAVAQTTNNRHHGGGGYQDDDDDIQEVVPVKSEPRDPSTAPVTAMTPVEEEAAYQVTDQQGTAANSGGGQLVVDDQYADDSYDYGDYGEGYDDGSGMIDPNTGMPIASGADGNKDEILALISRLASGRGCVWQCRVCFYSTKKKHNLMEHVEARHLDNTSVVCNICQALCKNKKSYRHHLYKHHKDGCPPPGLSPS